MTREEFQEQHGAAYAQILRHPAFNAGLILLSLDIANKIKTLSDDEIRLNSLVLLADFRGRLKYEEDILSLPIVETQETPLMPHEEYANSEEEAFEQFTRKHS